MARALISAGVTMVAAGGLPAQAGVWSWTGQSRLSSQYDDNVRLSLSNPTAASNVAADVSAELLNQDDAFSIRVTPRVVAVRYDDYETLNRTEHYLDLSAQRRMERGSTSLALKWLQDTTLTSELGSTGLTEVDRRHRNTALSLGHTILWTERTTVTGQAYVSANRYIDAANTGLVNYDYGSVVASTGYALTEASQLSLQVSAGRLQMPNSSAYDKTNYAATLNYDLRLDERWRVSLSLGPSRVQRRSGADDGLVYEAGVSRASDLLAFSANVERDVTPTGSGLLARRDQVSMRVSRPLTERASFSLGATWVRTRNVLQDGGLELNGVRYGNASASLSWKMAPRWTLSTSVGYALQRYQSSERAAERNYAALSVNWSGMTRDLQ